MIQASNELILGIELNEEYAQLTYFHPSVKGPAHPELRAGCRKLSAAGGDEKGRGWKMGTVGRHRGGSG